LIECRETALSAAPCWLASPVPASKEADLDPQLTGICGFVPRAKSNLHFRLPRPLLAFRLPLRSFHSGLSRRALWPPCNFVVRCDIRFSCLAPSYWETYYHCLHS